MIPTMGICYMLQYMDKLALSQATLLNLRSDLFYRFLWGGILMCHAACQNFAGLITARFFLGVGEAAVAPGFGLITGMFYKREEQPSRQGAWFVGNCIANIIGGVVAYGIGHSASSLQSWRLLFLALGAITSGYAVFLFFVLPDSPATASFLTPSERTLAMHRTLTNKTGASQSTPFQWSQVVDAAKDPQAWLLVIYTFCVNLANGGLTSFGAIIVEGFGFSAFKSLLIQMPMGFSQLVFLIITATIATYVSSARIPGMMLNVVVSVIGTVMIYTLDDVHKVAKMVGLCFVAAFAVNIPLALSIVSSNVAGVTKRSTVSVSIFAAYCIGNIVGPQFFLASEEPVYGTGIRASLCGLALGIFFLVLLLIFYIYENKRRDAKQSPMDFSDPHDLVAEQTNKTDRQILRFRYAL
ncbi:hypothetical protein N7462_006410 [Penicillium macrosclerotiorum]|uniref:uncharacterized protein n=1 Tax=Penicillium macrosclerotiorum TaxID=303699 RepID=UPI002546F143|nr:uncharacterized protein N7462_006410 [Penicillium macrosclerotiorum]KAJ5683245.1 hypothetical protein N7462_006410 [Penicillium macrosclerotiorum]